MCPQTAFQPFCTLNKTKVKQQPTQSSMARMAKTETKPPTPFLREDWKIPKINFLRISNTAHTWKHNFTRKPFWELATSKFYESDEFIKASWLERIKETFHFALISKFRVRKDGKQRTVCHWGNYSNKLKSKSHFMTTGWEFTMWLLFFFLLYPVQSFAEHSWALKFIA